MAINFLVWKMLRICHKEEVLVGVTVVAAQCAEGIIVIWAPYLLNLFLDDYKEPNFITHGFSC